MLTSFSSSHGTREYDCASLLEPLVQSMVSEPSVADAAFLRSKPRASGLFGRGRNREFVQEHGHARNEPDRSQRNASPASIQLLSSYISQYEDRLMPILYNVHQDGSRKSIPSKEQLITSVGDYQIIRTLGKGSTAKVKLAKHRATGELVAIKIVSRRKFQELVANKRPSHETLQHKENRILREALVMHLMDHPNIVKLLDMMVTDEWFILIFEYVEGVQLLDFIISHGHLRESLARKLFRQLLSAVHYCHLHAILHRDLKIENVIISSARGVCKLLDFGLSNFYDSQSMLTTYCGSLYFAAPELLQGRPYVGPEIDIWSLGVILYVMTTGKVPFDNPNVSKLHELIKRGDYEIPAYLSAALNNLLGQMLCTNPQQRITLNQIASHAWTTQEGALGTPFEEVHDAFIPPIDTLDEEAMLYLKRHLSFQYTDDEIERAVRGAKQDGVRHRKHPVVCLYRLFMEKKFQRLLGLRGNLACLDASFENISLVERPASVHIEPGMQSMLRPLAVSRIRAASVPSGSEAGMIARKRRVSSIGAAVMQPSPMTDQELLPLKSIYVSGLLSAHATGAKTAQDLKRRVTSALGDLHIDFEDHLSFLHCYHRSSLETDSSWQSQDGAVGFEICFVRIVLLGAYGIRFRRIEGHYKPYKRLCNLLLGKIKV